MGLYYDRPRRRVRLPNVRRIQFGWFLAMTGGAASTVGFLVYAYGVGGAGLVAVYVVLKTVPGVVIAPLVMASAPRLGIDRLLSVTTAARALLAGLAAAVVATGGPAWVVIALAGLGAALGGTYRPLQAAALPWLVRTPAELTTANVTAPVMENAASLIGPVVAALMLIFSDAASVLAVCAGLLAAAALALGRLSIPEEAAGVHSEGRVLSKARSGMAALAAITPSAGVPVLVFTQTLARGALLVLVVVLALDVLAVGQDAVGWLNAMTGIGGLLGAAVAAATIRLTRLGRSFVVGVALWGLPLALVAALPTPPVAYLALIVVGVGNSVEDAGVVTLVPRAVGPRLAGPALGAAELLVFAGLGTGSALAAVLIDAAGTRSAFAIVGDAVAVLAVAYAWHFTKLDRRLPAPGPELDLLRGLSMMAPLPFVVVEHLASSLEPRDYEPAEVVLREGDHGDRFHLIASGVASVSVRGNRRPVVSRGDGFGEIALLRDVPRTATVTAAEPLHTLTLTREAFLTAVAANTLSAAAADVLVGTRLTADVADPPP